MRKIFLGLAAAAAIAAPIALASSASASVAIDDNGVGFVGKGDVLTALGYKNDAAIQTAVEKGEVTFSGGTATAEQVVVDYKMTCLGSSEFGHRLIVQPGTVSTSVTAVPRANGQGKFTNGWDLTGQSTGDFVPGPVSSRVLREVKPEGCLLFSNAGVTQPMTVTTTGDSTSELFVTNGVTTVALPNTPIA